jgi:hypothetical protein
MREARKLNRVIDRASTSRPSSMARTTSSWSGPDTTRRRPIVNLPPSVARFRQQKWRTIAVDIEPARLEDVKWADGPQRIRYL